MIRHCRNKVKRSDSVVEDDSVVAEVFLKEGDEHFLVPDYVKALEFYNKGLLYNPDDVCLHTKKAETHLILNQLKECLKHAEKAIELNSTNAKAHCIAVKAALAQSDQEKARKFYIEAMASVEDKSELEGLEVQCDEIIPADVPCLVTDDEDDDDENESDVSSIASEGERGCEKVLGGEKELFIEQHRTHLEEVETEEKAHSEITTFVNDSSDSIYKQRYDVLVKEGSEAFLTGNNRKAADQFHSALNLFNGDGKKAIQLDENEVDILKCAFCMSNLEVGQYESIIESVNVLKEINEKKSQLYVMTNYLLGKAHLKLYRFKEAKIIFEVCRTSLLNDFNVIPLNWPGISKPIEGMQTAADFEVLVKSVLKDCTYPPRPDAMCRFENCLKSSNHILPSSEIYYSDPDFKGFIELICEEQCKIQFHVHCWKIWKEKCSALIKITDKEFLGRKCFTPDCKVAGGKNSMVVHIKIIGSNGKIKSQYPDMPKPTKQKKKKKEKKLDPKQKIKEEKLKRMKRERHDTESVDDAASVCSETCSSVDGLELPILKPRTRRPSGRFGGGDTDSKPPTAKDEGKWSASSNGEVPYLHSTELFVFKKPNEEDQVLKPKQQKKKKEKENKEKDKKGGPLPLGAFLQNVASSDSGSRYANGVSSGYEENRMHFPERGDWYTLYELSQALSNSLDEELWISYEPHLDDSVENKSIRDNLYSYFYDFLKGNGPLHIGDKRFKEQIECFPDEAQQIIIKSDGLVSFLLESFGFGLVDNYLCAIKHANEAKDLAMIKLMKSQSSLVKLAEVTCTGKQRLYCVTVGPDSHQGTVQKYSHVDMEKHIQMMCEASWTNVQLITNSKQENSPHEDSKENSPEEDELKENSPDDDLKENGPEEDELKENSPDDDLKENGHSEIDVAELIDSTLELKEDIGCPENVTIICKNSDNACDGFEESDSRLQAAVELADAATQTTADLVQRKVLRKVELERDVFQVENQELKDKLVQLKNSNSAEITRLTKNLTEAKAEVKTLKQSNNTVHQQKDSEVKKISAEKSKLEEEAKKAKSECKKSERLVEKVTEELSTEKERTQEFEEINRKLLMRIDELEERCSKLEVSLDLANERVQRAELEELKMRGEYASEIFQRYIPECIHKCGRLQAVRQKLDDKNFPTRSEFEVAIGEWEKALESLKIKREQFNEELKNQKEQVQKGCAVSSLPLLPVPSIPVLPTWPLDGVGEFWIEMRSQMNPAPSTILRNHPEIYPEPFIGMLGQPLFKCPPPPSAFTAAPVIPPLTSRQTKPFSGALSHDAIANFGFSSVSNSNFFSARNAPAVTAKAKPESAPKTQVVPDPPKAVNSKESQATAPVKANISKANEFHPTTPVKADVQDVGFNQDEDECNNFKPVCAASKPKPVLSAGSVIKTKPITATAQALGGASASTKQEAAKKVNVASLPAECQVFAGSLPKHLTSKDVEDFFSKFGHVVNVFLVEGLVKDDGFQNPNWAIVTFASPESVAQVFAAKPVKYGCHVLTIKPRHSSTSKPQATTAVENPAEKRADMPVFTKLLPKKIVPAVQKTREVAEVAVPLQGGAKPKSSKVTEFADAGEPVAEQPTKHVRAEPGDKSKYDKLLSHIHKYFPDRSRNDVALLLKLIRKKKQSLSGLSLNEIVEATKSFLEEIGGWPIGATSGAVNKELPKSGEPVCPWGNKSTQNSEFEGNVDDCSICTEKLIVTGTEKITQFYCKHRFHTECVRKWLKDNRTCPMCRTHVLMPDEFPSLN